MKKNINKLLIPILLFSYISFAVLSWILLFRDIRALKGISLFYTFLQPTLFSTREYLLHHGLNSIMTLLFLLIATIAVGGYLYSLRQKISLKITIVFAVLFQVILFFSYPILSTDIFSYLSTERVATEHNQNIWKVKPAAFQEDKFSKLADWKDTTSIYGGTHFSLYYLLPKLEHNNLVLLIIGYKFIAFLFSLATMAVVYMLLMFIKNKSVASSMRLLFWNPLYILEIAGSGHNDIVMIFFMLLAFYFFLKKSVYFAGILFALAVQVKVIPIILFVFCVLTLIKNKSFRDAIKMFMTFIISNSFFFIAMQITPIEFIQRVVFNNSVYWQSLPNIFSAYLPFMNKYLLIVFIIFCIYYCIRYLKTKDTPLESYAFIVLLYLFFINSAYWNWYVLWSLSVIPFITNMHLRNMTLLLSFTSLFAYPLLWFIYRVSGPAPIWGVVQYMLLFVPVYLTLFYKKVSIHKLIALGYRR